MSSTTSVTIAKILFRGSLSTRRGQFSIRQIKFDFQFYLKWSHERKPMSDTPVDSKFRQESTRGAHFALENSPPRDQDEVVEGDRHNFGD